MTVEYAPGRPIDIYGPAAATTVLLWHGSGPNERDVLAPLATAVADRGVLVLVPDWDSTKPDGGHADLLRSVKFARERGDSRLVVAGWSLGGTAAASLAINARKLGLDSVPAVCLAGAFLTTDPLSGQPFTSFEPSPRAPGSIRLVHGTRDDIVDIAGSRAFAAALQSAGWEADLTELDTDHAGIVGAEFVAERSRCVPSQDTQVIAALEQVVDLIVQSTSPPRPRL
ncbi:MAG: esterase [Kineosporiaceae bacterium]|nr:esterase [Aeromicrobium sp.]